MVVDVGLQDWFKVMAKSADDHRGHVQEGRHQNSLFYADDSMVALSDPRWIKGAFSTLVELFDRVSLKTNVWKTVGMVCRPCQDAGTQSEAAYGKQMKGSGPSY